MKFLTNKGVQPGAARVNIRALVNKAKIRKEKRNGKDVIIVPSATLPDNIVMNRVRYPAEEIANSFQGLEGTPAPLGHPMVNDAFVPALSPEAINGFYCGAWNANVRQEGGRVLLDKIIDVEVANRTEGGRALLEAIDKGEPVHTSNALLCELEAAEDDEEADFIARNMEWDHDAILLNETGAGTPEQGVGLMVNAEGDKITVINSIYDDADRELDWAVRSLSYAMEQRQKAGRLEALKSKLLDIFSPSETPPANEKEADMSNEKLDALSEKVNTLSESVKALVDGQPETIANAVTEAMKPILDDHSTALANAKAKDEAELADLQSKIVNAGLGFDAETVKTVDLATARTLANGLTEKKADNGGGKVTTNGADDFADYDMNAAIVNATKEA